ncbi:unnamed protein product [Prunus armeniaca]|uniref:Uncharacterized protein n=1 Tax=Prunus armeniaca TaxID=36596 RepID=A0A6J5VEG7_PRUAR|nr:unnamed protein product [Prunus armeniaca]CAB4314693.1 unnamed protein product [Prunus armeniaca]
MYSKEFFEIGSAMSVHFCQRKNSESPTPLHMSHISLISFVADRNLLHAAKMEVDKIMLTDAPLLFPPGRVRCRSSF